MNAGEREIKLFAIVAYHPAGSLVFCIHNTGEVSSLRYFSKGNPVFLQYPSGNPTNTHCLINTSFSTIALSAKIHQNDLQKRMILHFTPFKYSHN